MPDRDFETISDAHGRVLVGWVGEQVLYARFDGGMSAELGSEFATHVAITIARRNGVRYFADAQALTHYDLLARSAFVRMALRFRQRFSSFVMLTWPAGVGPATESFAATIGGSVDILADAREFDIRLSAAAPLAKQKLRTAATAAGPFPIRAPLV